MNAVPAGGRVVLVGAGPGDPGLITVKGLAALRAADVVVADRLVPAELLADLPPHVQVVQVHKVPRGPSVAQERIHEIMLDHALAGRYVVRLKGGDPFVFGHGGEEIDACVAAGVPVEVVPGVTSAVAVPGLSGIPLTHRGLVQAFTVVSAHVPPGDPRCTVDWAALAATRGTLVVLMGVQSMPVVARTLIGAGLPADTPVACLQDGAGPDLRRVDCTLATVGTALREHAVAPPAVIVVGEVARRGLG